MTVRLIVALVCGGLVACRGGTPSPVAPSPTPTPTPSIWTLTGQIVSSTTQQPISGARVLGATSDASGLFNVNGSGSRASQRATIEASGYLTRTTTIGAGTENPRIDLIPESAASFYRQIAHGAFEGGNEPIRRWTTAPQFYITQDGSLTPEDIRRVQVGILAATNQMSPFGNVGIEVGPARAEQVGWIAVMFGELSGGACGEAFVAANPGRVTIRNTASAPCGFSCPVGKITTDTVAHEAAHALGFWHGEAGILKASAARACTTDPVFTPAERAAAQLVYRRPVGNEEPDIDPIGQAFLGRPLTIVD